MSETIKFTEEELKQITELRDESQAKVVEFGQLNLERLLATQLGLTHLFSRHKISEDVEKQDKHILQSTALITQMEKNLNLFCMRIKEWYAWHFPELSKIIPDNRTYVRCVKLI